MHSFFIRTNKFVWASTVIILFSILSLKLCLSCSYIFRKIIWGIRKYSLGWFIMKNKKTLKNRSALFLNCSYFFGHFEPHSSYKIVLIKKECIIWQKVVLAFSNMVKSLQTSHKSCVLSKSTWRFLWFNTLSTCFFLWNYSFFVYMKLRNETTKSYRKNKIRWQAYNRFN